MSRYRTPPVLRSSPALHETREMVSTEVQNPLNKSGVQIRIVKAGALETIEEISIASGQTPKSFKKNFGPKRV